MKQLPILFSTEMVQAILAGRKTVTRRVINPQPDSEPGSECSVIINDDGTWEELLMGFFPYRVHLRMPYQPGDILYVRETYYQVGHWEPDNDPKKKRKTGRQGWKFVPDSPEIRYSDNPPDYFRKGRHKESPEVSTWYRRLGRFMPKSAARIWLQVTDVRAERLQDITEEDAIREGVEPSCSGDVSKCPSVLCKYGCQSAGEYVHYTRSLGDFPAFSAIESFDSLWQSIHGMASWEANPWVWPISFDVLSINGKPENI